MYEVKPREMASWLQRDLKEIPGEFRVRTEKGYLCFSRKPQKGELRKYPRERLKEWPFNSGTYDLGDPCNPVAFCSPYQDKELLDAAIMAGVCIAGPCLTPRGVELMLTNLVSNPNIRFLVLAGKDSGHLTGDLIYKLKLHGVDEHKRVRKALCPSFPYLKNLPPDVIERFREQVEVLNLIGVEDHVVLTLICRLCLQEPANAFELSIPWLKKTHLLFDPGCYPASPLRVPFSLFRIEEARYEGETPISQVVYASTIEEAYRSLLRVLRDFGIWVRQESGRSALDSLHVQIKVFDVKSFAIPQNYRPTEYISSDDLLLDYLEKYSTWVYLLPFSDVRFDPELQAVVPCLASPDRISYSYGTRLVAWGIDWEGFCDQAEKRDLMEAVEGFQSRFYSKLPSFRDILAFYSKLGRVQGRSFNQLLAVAKNLCEVVRRGITGTYRLYMTLQIPPKDLSSLLKAHPPCFCLYEPFLRKCKYVELKEDAITRRLPVPSFKLAEFKGYELKEGWLAFPKFELRAHDYLAFPANAWGGVRIMDFLRWFIERETKQRVEWGAYVHSAACLHIVDYFLDKEDLKTLTSLG